MNQATEYSHMQRTNLNLLPRSWAFHEGVEYALVDTGAVIKLAVLGQLHPPVVSGFVGDASEFEGQTLQVCPLTPENAAVLRSKLPWLRPKLLGTQTSAGMGDRLGLATPGHVKAVQRTDGKIAPIFAQQSIREMTRTGRSPVQVMDDAMWGVFQEGWRSGFGADADHLKTIQDIDSCFAAGFTFFTIDPGDYVDNRAESASLNDLLAIAETFPSEMKDEAYSFLNRRYDLEGRILQFTENTLYKALVKYGHAVQHVAVMYHHLEKLAGAAAFELEVSVDETDQPTSHAEHIYIASELKRMGVRWVSLAPRFVGRFEKGVDYIGNPAEFEADIAGHAAIAREFGPYKLSLHSGSDKFSIYPAAMRQTYGLVHLKTAGTSYLEALRTIAAIDVDLFREIYAFACERYEIDRASYHVSAEVDRAPQPAEVTDWPGLLNQFDAREILHVTFGSVLTQRNSDGTHQFYDRLMSILRRHPDAYTRNLEEHFSRHLLPFATDTSPTAGPA